MSRTRELICPSAGYEWTGLSDPVLVVDSGDTVLVHVPMAGSGQVNRDVPNAPIREKSRMIGMVGPVVMANAQPGDVLRLDFLSLAPGAWGWAAALPDLGLLGAKFPVRETRVFDVGTAARICITDGAHTAVSPFLGVVGIDPGVTGSVPSFLPHRAGGNLDCRYLLSGSSVFLPVMVPGARLWLGDPHASQGDGEICGTAVEVDMDCAIRLSLLTDSRSPLSYTTRVPAEEDGASDVPQHGFVGVGLGLREASVFAAEAAVRWISETYGMSELDAYFVCGLAGDLKILQAVNHGVCTVAMVVSDSVFSSPAIDPK